MKLLIFLLVIGAFLKLGNGFKVLGIFPFGSTSHFAIGNGIAKALHRAGHEVTVISPYPQKKPLENFRDVSTKDLLDKQIEENALNGFKLGEMHPLIMLTFLYKFGNDLIEAYMNHENVKEFFEKDDEHFDVCVLEVFNIEAFVGVADKYGCVVISYTTFAAFKWVNEMTSNKMFPSYIPHPYLHYAKQMTFMQRVYNNLAWFYEDLVYNYLHLPNQRRLYNKYFPNAKKSFDEMYKSSAIIFMNNHVSSSSARPYLPNMIEIAGIHIEPVKPLPKDIQEFLDSADNGVILFSMGSIVQSSQWPEEKREAFVKAFGKLKQKVLWKYENETLPNKPDNVMISKWIPQRDILAHPKIRVFVTHGGLLGTTEALTEGVPVLGIPVFGDQIMSMKQATARGYGLDIYFEDVTEEKLTDKLDKLLNDPKYHENSKIISKRFNDRPMTPQESVVYWTEFAIRHQGAPHLKADGNSLSFFVFYSYDVYAFLLLIVGSFVFFLIKLKKLCSKNPKTSLKMKKK